MHIVRMNWQAMTWLVVGSGLWLSVISIIRTGHTKILWSLLTIVDFGNQSASDFRRLVHLLMGDRGLW